MNAASAAKSRSISNVSTTLRFRSCTAWVSMSTWYAPNGTIAIAFTTSFRRGVTQGKFTVFPSQVNVASIVIAKSRPYENTSPKLRAAPDASKRESCSMSVLPQTSRCGLPGSQETRSRCWPNMAIPSRWQNSFALPTGYYRRSMRPEHAADAGSVRIVDCNNSSICGAAIPNYGRNWLS